MWVRVGLVAGRILLRLLIRLAPFLLIGLAALLKRYRWPLYYRALALRSSIGPMPSVGGIVLRSAGGLLLLSVVLFILVTHLSPR